MVHHIEIKVIWGASEIFENYFAHNSVSKICEWKFWEKSNTRIDKFSLRAWVYEKREEFSLNLNVLFYIYHSLKKIFLVYIPFSELMLFTYLSHLWLAAFQQINQQQRSALICLSDKNSDFLKYKKMNFKCLIQL